MLLFTISDVPEVAAKLPVKFSVTREIEQSRGPSALLPRPAFRFCAWSLSIGVALAANAPKIGLLADAPKLVLTAA